MLAPICLFTYNRLSETQQMIESLKGNMLASESELFIFSDGPKDKEAISKVEMVRDYLDLITGFKSVSITKSSENKGLAQSIISGVSKIIQKHGKVIVVEDDLILSKNFLSFMNSSLDYYTKKNQIFSISGFSLKVQIPRNHCFDMYFWGRAQSWGWATWEDRWSSVDWDIKDYPSFINSRKMRNSFNKYGSDLSEMLVFSQKGKIDSWFIRFAYNQFKQNRLTILPITSKVINNGFMEDATHCNTYNQVTVDFDRTTNNTFRFASKTKINHNIGRQVYKYHSRKFRIIRKLYTTVFRMGLIKQRKQIF